MAPTPATRRRQFRRRGEGRFTMRAAILSILIAVLVLTLAYPVQQYLAQRSQIAETERAQAVQQQRIALSRERLQAWNDPEYVAGQARKRLQLYRVGEKPYLIQDPSRAATGGSSGHPADRSVSAPRDERSWYGRLWDGVAVADSGSGVN